MQTAKNERENYTGPYADFASKITVPNVVFEEAQTVEPFAWTTEDCVHSMKIGADWCKVWAKDVDATACVPLFTCPAPGKQPDVMLFNAAIQFAIEQGEEASEFLNAWRHGDTSEWPEFAAAPVTDYLNG